MESKEFISLVVFYYVRWVKYLYLQYKVLTIPILRGRKRLKSKEKSGQNDQKFQNIRQMYTYENNCVGQFQVGSEILFLTAFCLEWTSDFLLQSIGKWPLNRLEIAGRSF